MSVVNTFPVEEACAHLRGADPKLALVMDRVGPYTAQMREGDPYASLLRTILFQQLAGAAASAIQGRFFALYGDAFAPPSPEQLLTTTLDGQNADANPRWCPEARESSARTTHRHRGLVLQPANANPSAKRVTSLHVGPSGTLRLAQPCYVMFAAATR